MNRKLLISGDLAAIAILTVVGFASHDEVALTYLPRMASTFFPLVIGWFTLAPAMGLFDPERVRDARQLWRPALAGFFASQVAVILRGLWLNGAVLPLFGLILGGSVALGMVVWRGIWIWLAGRKK